jgi:hypothetical protein
MMYYYHLYRNYVLYRVPYHSLLVGQGFVFHAKNIFLACLRNRQMLFTTLSRTYQNGLINLVGSRNNGKELSDERLTSSASKFHQHNVCTAVFHNILF